MIYSYGITQQGHYHIKNNTPCQDAHLFKRWNDNFAIGVVADGLGSELYSDIASKIAVREVVSYCENVLTETSELEEILSVLKASFCKALETIEKTAKENNHDVTQYDTTLAVAIFLKGTVYFGNSGDSGIVVLNSNGTYESITEQQRDENGCLYPLCFGENYWVFGFKENVASVLLVTDGIYETLFPYLLQGEEISIYVALAHFMMSNACLNFSSSSENNVLEKMESFISGISAEQVSDDKTVLVMHDDTITVNYQPESYYQSPNWAVLKRKRDEVYKKLAYPHLFE